MTSRLPQPPGDGARRLVAVRAGAVVAALFWAVPFFGLVDLATIVVPGEFLPSVPLEASWGAFFTVIVAGAFVAVARRPAGRLAPAVQLLVGALALVGGAVLGRRPEPLVVAAVVGVLGALLLVGTPRHLGRLRPHVPLLVVALVAAPFWSAYAWQAAAASRLGVDDDISVGVPHWAVQSATGLAVAVCALIAAAWPFGRRLFATCAGLAAVLLGVATVAYPEATGAMSSRVLGVAAILWGVALAAAVLAPRPGRRGDVGRLRAS